MSLGEVFRIFCRPESLHPQSRPPSAALGRLPQCKPDRFRVGAGLAAQQREVVLRPLIEPRLHSSWHLATVPRNVLRTVSKTIASLVPVWSQMRRTVRAMSPSIEHFLSHHKPTAASIPQDVIVYGLVLAVIAPTDEQAAETIALAEDIAFSADLTDAQMDACKDRAEAILDEDSYSHVRN